jgi:hypothetical protein
VTGDYLVAWLRAFAFTQLVEVPIYMRFARATPAQAFGASAITHPLLWFVIFPLSPLGYTATSIAGELWVWLVEAAYLRWIVRIEPRLHRALLWSLLANAASEGLGELCRWAFGYP